MNQNSGLVLMSRQDPVSGWAAGQLGRRRSGIWDSSFSTTPMCCCLSGPLTKNLHHFVLSGFSLQRGSFLTVPLACCETLQ